jgi:putative DNA primase/helicase
VKLLRTASMRAMPDPDGDTAIDELRHFVNVSDEDFILLVAWLVAALRHRGPFPILVVAGEQGAGKSMFSRMMRALADPSAALAYDNLSAVHEWLSDGLCRLATGGGFATRMLHTDREEMIFEGQRPIILNGIPLLTARADLADRAVTIHLRSIPEHERRPEDILWTEFEAKRPAILSALLVGVSAALQHVGGVRLERSPRMADFAKWVVAAEPGLGWEPGTFLAAYYENRRDVAEASFEADSVAIAIRDFVASEHPSGWEGTSTELLASLNSRVAEGVRKARSWPLTAQGLGNRVDRAAPLLRTKGFAIERHRGQERTIAIIPPRGRGQA